MSRRVVLVVVSIVSASAGAGTPAFASSCASLAAELSGLGRGRGDAFSGAAERQRAELARAESLAARCAVLSSPACADLPQRLAEMRRNLSRLELAARRSGGGASAGRRARLAAAMQRAGCAQPSAVAQAPMAPPSGGLLGFLGLSAPRAAPEIITRGPPPAVRREAPAERALRRRIEAPDPPTESETRFSGFGRGPYRTLCVRACDGYFWPVSYAVSRMAFERDEAVCRAACPNLEVALYAHRNPGGTSAQAISMFGQPYADLPTASRFREAYHPACQCRPASPPRDAETAGPSFTPVPSEATRLPPRSAEAPLVVGLSREVTSDRVTGDEGLRGVYRERAGPVTPSAPEDAPPPSDDRSAEAAP